MEYDGGAGEVPPIEASGPRAVLRWFRLVGLPLIAVTAIAGAMSPSAPPPPEPGPWRSTLRAEAVKTPELFSKNARWSRTSSSRRW